MSEIYEPEKTVFVDMDGVIADFDSEVLSRMAQRHPEFRPILPKRHFYIYKDYPEYEQKIREVCADEGFFGSFKPIDSAVEGWQCILEAGFQPRILSAPLRSNSTSEQEKRAWLTQHLGPRFGDQVAHDAIFTKHKHHFDGVALIDDRPEIEHANEATWSHIIMHYPFNAHIDTDLRLKDWQDQRLEGILALAKERYIRKLGARAL